MGGQCCAERKKKAKKSLTEDEAATAIQKAYKARQGPKLDGAECAGPPGSAGAAPDSKSAFDQPPKAPEAAAAVPEGAADPELTGGAAAAAPGLSEADAATRLQAMERGRQARKDLAAGKEAPAATPPGAPPVEASAADEPAKAPEAPAAEEPAAQAPAAEDPAAQAHREQQAAVKLQAAERGRQGRIAATAKKDAGGAANPDTPVNSEDASTADTANPAPAEEASGTAEADAGAAAPAEG